MLTNATVKALRPAAKPYKRADAQGLYVLVTPSGGRLWRYNYMVRGRQKTAALGSYPAVSLADARQARDAAKLELRAGADPVEIVKVEKAEARAAATTFADVGAEWYRVKMVGEHKAAQTLHRARWLLKTLGDELGSRPIATVEAPDILTLLRRIEAAGQREVPERLRATASAVFRFGIATGVCKRDPAADLRGALTNRKGRPRPAITDPAAVGKLLRDIDKVPRAIVRLALQLLALTFVRPSELALAEWREFDLAGDGTWTIPAGRMKMRKEFTVPLSKQALAVLKEAHTAAGSSRFVFPSRQMDRPIQASKMVKALRSLGYSADQVSAHGFRSTASTLLNQESEFTPDSIELCLAHVAGDVRGVYNRAQRWIERRDLMQWWSDRLDGLRQRGEVVKLSKPMRHKVDA